jgi:arylsulfatase A-like enzyme
VTFPFKSGPNQNRRYQAIFVILTLEKIQLKINMRIIFLILSVVLISCGSKHQPGTGNGLPNIILIMADDIGIGDISCYGAELIKTANIDKLASQGTRFDRYYTAGAVCAPTRYSVLTGRYPFRTKELIAGRASPWDYLFIEPDRTTIGSLCKQMGYKTAAIGKWHLGYGTEEEIDWGGSLKPGPLEIGFDYHWGVPRNHNDRVRAYVENHSLYGLDPDQEYKPATSTERVQGLLHERVDDRVDSTLTAKVFQFIRSNKDSSFFVYFTPCAAHTHVTPNVRFRGTSQAGQYGDYVQELDHHVGEIMTLLDELKLSEQTLIIFTSDNGGQLRDVSGAGLGINLADESGDVRAKARTPKIKAREMGHRTNLDLREGKGSPYEGGFRVPCIMRWPGKIDPGTTSLKLINSADYLATFSDLFDMDLSANAGEDSFSFLDVLTGEEVENPRRSVALHSSRARSFVDGVWKLVDYSYRVNPMDQYELYNLIEDPAESTDLALSNPEQLNTMRNALKTIVEADGSR